MHNSPLKEQKLIRVLSGTVNRDSFDLHHDYGSMSVPWKDISHLIAVRLKRGEKIPTVLFFVRGKESIYYIEANSFNYRQFLKNDFTIKRDTNFFLLMKTLLSHSQNAYVDWPFRDSLKGGISLLPEFTDLIKLSQYCNSMRTEEKKLEKKEAPSEDSPLVIFQRKLEIFVSRRKEALRYFSKAHSYIARARVDRSRIVGDEVISNFGRAKHELDRSLQVDPFILQSFVALAGIHQELGEDREAVELYIKALEIDPTLEMRSEAAHAVFVQGLASLYQKREDHKAENWALYKYMGLFPQGREAEQCALSLSREAHVDIDWYYNYVDGIDSYENGDYKTSLERLEKAIVIWPSFRWSHHWKGKTLKALGDRQESLKSYQVANSLAWDVLTDIEISALLQEDGKMEAAEELLRHICERMPDFYLPYALLGKLLFSSRRSGKESLEYLLKAAEKNPVGKHMHEIAQIGMELAKEQKNKKDRAPEIAKEWARNEIVENRFRIEEIFKGGMGIVYIVTDIRDSKPYAIKSFQEQFLWDKKIIQMFIREAEVWVKLGKHKNIVQAEQVRNVEGNPFIFLEYVDGTDLEKLLKEGPLQVRVVLDFALQFCEGMSYAYKKLGIIHQDIKPSNCLITGEGILKITDFGLVKIFSEEGSREPVRGSPGGSGGSGGSGGAAGTLPYMSPEQLLCLDTINTTSDIYCFGSMFYEMLTGAPPYGREDVDECIDGHLNREPPDPCRGREDIARDLGDIVLKCLQKKQSDRYGSFEELLAALQDFYQKNYGFGFRTSAHELDISLEDIIARGESLMALEQNREALVHFDEGLKLNGDLVRLIIDKGECLYRLMQLKESKQCFDKALQLEPDNPQIHYHLGNIHASMKENRSALRCYDRSLELEPENAAVWSKKGVLFDVMGQGKEALRCYDRSIKINPRLSDTWINRGNLLSKLDRLQEAIECYTHAIEITPRNLRAWYNKGILNQKLNDHKAAIESFAKVTEFNPGNANAWLGSGISHFKLGNMEGALECYDKALSHEPRNFQLLIFKGNCLYELGRLEEAAACFGKALAVNNRNIQAWVSNGLIMGELYHLEQGISCYKKALELNPNNEFVIKALQRLKKREGKASIASKVIDGSTGDEIFGGQELEVGFESFDKAIQHHSCLLEVFPGDPRLWYRKGILLSISGRDSEAMACFENALKIDSDFQAPKLKEERIKYSLIKSEKSGRGGILDRLVSREKITPARSFEEGTRFLEKGELRFALKCFQDALRNQPEMVEAWRYACETLIRMGYLQEALESITNGLARSPLSTDLWKKKGSILEKMGRVSEALEAYGLAIRIFPWNFDNWVQIISCLENSSQQSLAKDYAFKAIYYLDKEYKKGSREPELFKYKALFSTILERYVEATLYLDKLLQKDPEDPGLLGLKGIAQLRLGEWSNALKCFEIAEKNSPYRTDLLFWQALCMKELGDRSEALGMLERVIDLDPGLEFAWYYKGIILSEAGEKEQGLHFVSTASETIPHAASLWAARGIMLFSQSKERDALWCFDKAIELNPQDINFWLNKGIILNRLNKPDQAVYCFNRILEMDSDDHKIWYFKGLSHFLMKNWNAAIECGNRVLEINPRGVDAWMLKGAAFYRSGLFSEAIACFDRALEVDPERAEIWNNRGVLMRNMDKLEESVNCYNKALQVDPRFATAWLNKGRWLSELSRYDEALVCYERVLELAPDDAHAWLDMGHCHFALERYGEALRCYDRSIKLDPGIWECWSGKGFALIRLGRMEESIFALEHALEMNQEANDLWIHKGIALSSLNRKEEALGSFDQCLNNDEDNEIALYDKSVVLKKLGHRGRAGSILATLKEMNPELLHSLPSDDELLSPPVKHDYRTHIIVESKRDSDLYIKKPPHSFSTGTS